MCNSRIHACSETIAIRPNFCKNSLFPADVEVLGLGITSRGIITHLLHHLSVLRKACTIIGPRPLLRADRDLSKVLTVRWRTDLELWPT